jgi:hypothetical protein
MRKFSLTMFVVLAFAFTTTAQIINVTGGPGRVNNSTVIEGLPFTATVSGLNGTPQRWTVGIGDINNQLIFNTSSTTISNAIVDRTISGNTAVISVGATNGRGVARFLTVVPPPSCSSELLFLTATDCSVVAAIVNPIPSGVTSYSWSVSPSVPFTINSGGRSISLNNVTPGVNYTVSVTITGGVCNGSTLTETVQCSGGGGFLDQSAPVQNSESLRVFPNPATGNELNVEFGKSSDNYRMSIFSETGQPIEGIIIEKKGNAAKVGVSNLTPGTYYLRTIDENGEAATQRFRIE